MGFTCGIVGLPNVGKSTIFNALTSSSQAEAVNYPFCTIEPNQGRVFVPDDRIDNLSGINSTDDEPSNNLPIQITNTPIIAIFICPIFLPRTLK